MNSIVPGKKGTAEIPRILDRAESLGKFRTVFQRLELRFRIRVIIAYMWAAVRLCHTQVSQKIGYRLRGHAAPTISVNSQLAS